MSEYDRPRQNIDTFWIERMHDPKELHIEKGIRVVDVINQGTFLDPTNGEYFLWDEHREAWGIQVASNLIDSEADDLIEVWRDGDNTKVLRGSLPLAYTRQSPSPFHWRASCRLGPIKQNKVEPAAVVAMVEQPDFTLIIDPDGAQYQRTRQIYASKAIGVDSRIIAKMALICAGEPATIASGRGKLMRLFSIGYDPESRELSAMPSDIQPNFDDSEEEDGEDDGPDFNDHEPLRPIRPHDSAAVALEPPLDDPEPFLAKGSSLNS